jgi:hypothetical protein
MVGSMEDRTRLLTSPLLFQSTRVSTVSEPMITEPVPLPLSDARNPTRESVSASNELSFVSSLSISVVVHRVMIKYLTYNVLSLAHGELSIMPVLVPLIRNHLPKQYGKTKLVDRPLNFQLSASLSCSPRKKRVWRLEGSISSP